jgi:hypothetical protein
MDRVTSPSKMNVHLPMCKHELTPIATHLRQCYRPQDQDRMSFTMDKKNCVLEHTNTAHSYVVRPCKDGAELARLVGILSCYPLL